MIQKLPLLDKYFITIKEPTKSIDGLEEYNVKFYFYTKTTKELKALPIKPVKNFFGKVQIYDLPHRKEVAVLIFSYQAIVNKIKELRIYKYKDLLSTKVDSTIKISTESIAEFSTYVDLENKRNTLN